MRSRAFASEQVVLVGDELKANVAEASREAAGVELAFIAPGRPVENAFIASFNRRLRDEFLNVEIFFDLPDLAHELKHWRSDYNRCRPPSALADQTPEEFARRQARAAQGSPGGGPCGTVLEPSRACRGGPDPSAPTLPAATIFENSYQEPG